MRKFGKILLLSATIAFTVSALADEVVPFSMDLYRKECGGTVYARCGGLFSGKLFGGSSQVTIFEHAKAWAKQQNKLILAFSGYDWCPPCRKDVLQFISQKEGASPELLALVQKNYIVLTVDRDMNGAAEVIQQLGMPVSGFSEISIFDPQKNTPLQIIRFPQLLSSLPILKCTEVKVGGKIIKYTEPDPLFDSKLVLLQSPDVSLLDYVSANDKKLNKECR